MSHRHCCQPGAVEAASSMPVHALILISNIGKSVVWIRCYPHIVGRDEFVKKTVTKNVIWWCGYYRL